MKKWSFSLSIYSVNVTKSAVSCRFGHIYWRNPEWKTSLFVQCKVEVEAHNHSKHEFFSQVLFKGFRNIFWKSSSWRVRFQGHVFSITLVNNGCFAKFKRSGFCAYVSMFEAVYFRNGRFYFKVNNYKEREIDGVNFFFYLSKLNCLRKSKKHKHLRFCLSIKYKK